MSSPFTIPKEDHHLVMELVKTLPLLEVAKKWEVGRSTINRLLIANNTSAIRLRHEYRMEVIKSNPSMSARGLSKLLGISLGSVYKMMRD